MEKNHSIEDNNVNILAREDRLLERGVKEYIYVELERPHLDYDITYHPQCNTEFSP